MVASAKLPISIKGVVFEDGRVWLRKNPRGEWELPGGRLDEGEQPEHTVIRELREELGFISEVIDIVDSGVLHVELQAGKISVLIVTYLCRLKSKLGEMEMIGEDGNAEFQAFFPSELRNLKIPEIYRASVLKALNKIECHRDGC